MVLHGSIIFKSEDCHFAKQVDQFIQSFKKLSLITSVYVYHLIKASKT